jgi:hypothetical protein
MTWEQKHPRKEPYTGSGIKRVPCVRCGQKAVHQWNVCADGNHFRALCLPSDIDLNRVVLEWANDPHAKAKVEAYAKGEKFAQP